MHLINNKDFYFCSLANSQIFKHKKKTPNEIISVMFNSSKTVMTNLNLKFKTTKTELIVFDCYLFGHKVLQVEKKNVI